jgi:hypothetical protein
MSAFYGIPEGDEIPAVDLSTLPTPVTEPVDDPAFVVAARMPERDFGPRAPIGRFTKRYDIPERAAFGGVNFEAMVNA